MIIVFDDYNNDHFDYCYNDNFDDYNNHDFDDYNHCNDFKIIVGWETSDRWLVWAGWGPYTPCGNYDHHTV